MTTRQATDKIYEDADAIELVMERKPVGHWWTISALARAAHISNADASSALAWLLQEQYILSNGRGGAWINYARKH
jgi:hypothetical protein